MSEEPDHLLAEHLRQRRREVEDAADCLRKHVNALTASEPGTPQMLQLSRLPPQAAPQPAHPSSANTVRIQVPGPPAQSSSTVSLQIAGAPTWRNPAIGLHLPQSTARTQAAFWVGLAVALAALPLTVSGALFPAWGLVALALLIGGWTAWLRTLLRVAPPTVSRSLFRYAETLLWLSRELENKARDRGQIVNAPTIWIIIPTVVTWGISPFFPTLMVLAVMHWINWGHAMILLECLVIGAAFVWVPALRTYTRLMHQLR